MIVFLIITISGILLLIIVTATESEIDDAILLPIICGIINLGAIGGIMFFVSSNLVLAIILGSIFSIITGLIVYFIRIRLETKSVDFKELEGEKATVEIPFSKFEIGRITVILKSTGEEEGFPARAFDPNDPPYEKGDKVIIKKYDGATCAIVKSINWELKKLKKENNQKEEMYDGKSI